MENISDNSLVMNQKSFELIRAIAHASSGTDMRTVRIALHNYMPDKKVVIIDEYGNLVKELCI